MSAASCSVEKIPIQAVFDRQDEACRKLAHSCPRVHERRRVRQKLKVRHRIGELVGAGVRTAAMPPLDRSHVRRHSPEHLVRGLNDLTRRVGSQVPRVENALRVGRQCCLKTRHGCPASGRCHPECRRRGFGGQEAPDLVAFNDLAFQEQPHETVEREPVIAENS
jgi:hypothetical protein